MRTGNLSASALHCRYLCHFSTISNKSCCLLASSCFADIAGSRFMFKNNPLIPSTHNFIFQAGEIVVPADLSCFTTAMLRSLQTNCNTGDFFSEPDVDYAVIDLSPKVDLASAAIALSCPTGVLHPLVKMPLRQYFAQSLGLIIPTVKSTPLPRTDTNLSSKEIGDAQLLNFSKKHSIDIAPLPNHFAKCDNTKVALSSRAKHMLLWRASCQFCAKCGKKLTDCPDESARECSCGQKYFPRIEPCVIVRVTWGDKILLARHTYRNQDVYTCVAGFIEGGETAENAVHREVFEETNLRVKNVRYLGSQAWPFPDQLMLAFECEYDGGTMHLQADEISDARWFSIDDLPPTPRIGSVAYKLIHNMF